MNRSRQSSRESRRFSRFNPFGKKSRRASELAAAAGERPEMLEQLEARQMLFTMTISPASVDPLTGVGTATAFFGYAIPYFGPTQAITAQPPTNVIEDFATDNPGNPGANGIAVPANFVFDQSNLQLAYTPGQLTSARLVREVPNTQGANALEFSMQQGDHFSFRVSNGPNGTSFLQLRQIAMDISLNFPPANMLVELVANGVVITSFTGQALLNQSNGLGNYTFASNTAFDEIRFTAANGPAGPFRIDNVAFTLPSDQFGITVNARLFGSEVVFTGPAGATVQIFDLYGRDMIETIALGIPAGATTQIPAIDPDGDGIPNFNDGIGKVVIAGTNGDSALTMFGGTIAAFQGVPPPNNERVEGGFAFTLPDTTLGLFDAFEAAGFGYFAVQANNAFTVTGLPEGPGSVIIGSPWVRPQNNYNPGGLATGGANVNRPDQGIFSSSSISTIYAHAILHGISRIDGFVDKFVTGYTVGSVSVSGDLGYFSSGTDAGVIANDNGASFTATGSTLTVGRTLGEFSVAGRSMMNVTVIGDLNSPNSRPPRDVLRHYEREFMTGQIGQGVTPRDTIRRVLANNNSAATNRFLSRFGGFFGRQDQPLVYGTGYLRDDTILSAEWIGNIGTAVQLFGELGRQDVVNATLDGSDVYGFAADGTQDIVVQLDGTLLAGIIGPYMRIVDSDGRTVAAPQAATRTSDFVGMRYRPTSPGVYYLVVQSPNSGVVNYVLNISGLAATSLGSYRTGANSGRSGAVASSVQVLSGSMGSMRVGTAFENGAAAEIDPAAIFNEATTAVNANDDTPDEYMSLRSMTVSVFASLYNITTGSDIGDTLSSTGFFTLSVGENLGTIITGRSAVVGIGPTQGDLRFVNMNIGGSIAMLDIRGAIGIDQDINNQADFPDSIVVKTGTRANVDPRLKGDIGMIRAGSHVGGDTINLRTSDHSTIGGFLVSQDIDFNPAAPDIGIYGGVLASGENMLFGFGSDIRFFDTPKIDLSGFENSFYPLVAGAAPFNLTDDAGGQVTIQIIGGNANAGGLIRVMPIQGSLGVAIGRIEVNLDGGARLQITSLGNPGSTDIVSIGRIQVTGSDAASSIGIVGNTQVDVWRILQTGGTLFNEIVNQTPKGDIVAVDMVALNRLEIRTGDLGRTQVPSWGPTLIGPFLGVAGSQAGGQSDVNGPMLIPQNAMTPFWNGALYRPVNDSRVGTPTPNSWLDDVGSPINPYLNGVVVRTLNLATVEVGGAVGDVIANDLTAGNGNIVSVIANFDRVTPTGRFDGIIGTIFGNRISLVDIGDGLAQQTQAPLSTTGIFANDDILRIVGDRIPGASISSVINAANNIAGNTTPQNFATDGIDQISLKGGGSFVDAFIGSMNLDYFWNSFMSPDDGVFSGSINQFTGDAANFLRSRMFATTLNNFKLTGGYYDASQTNIAGNITRMEAKGYRNSTISGGDLEFLVNEVLSGLDIGLITTTGLAGDMEDLRVDALGTIFEISANNISRAQVDADVGIQLVRTTSDIRGSAFSAGLLTRGTIGGSIRSSEVRIAGPLVNLTVADQVTNTSIDVSGPDGRIDKISVRQIYTGSIRSAGPIGTIEVTQGDLIANIVTVVNIRGVAGNIGLLSAGRDIDIDGDIGGTITKIVAGRHLGSLANPRPIVVHGDIDTIDLSHGQLYSDIRIDQRLVTSLFIGAVANKPGVNSQLGSGSLIAFGSIAAVTIEGDFGGDIISYSGGIGVVTINNGSLLSGATIAAYDGNLNNIVINAGHLLGNVHADYILFSIRLNGSSDGVFGDIGVNPNLSQGNPYNSLRNQLPPGVIATTAIDGPRITAGYNIGRIVLTNGSIFETFIYAGRAIGTIDVTGDIRNDALTTGRGTTIAAGSSLNSILVSGNILDTLILGGVKSFGADNLPGGVGANADTIQSARFTSIVAGGQGANVAISVGMNAGADGQYNTGDETVVLGISYVREATFGGGVSNVSVYADSPTLTVSPGVQRAGTSLPTADLDLSDGSPVPGGAIANDGTPFAFTLPGGIQGSIVFNGPGQAYFDGLARRIILVNTKLTSTLTVTANGTLNDFDIVTNDDASMGQITVGAVMAGDSDIVVDAYLVGVNVAGFAGTGSIKSGMNVKAIVIGTFAGGFINAAYWARDIVINGNFGVTTGFGEARIDILAGSSITVNGTNAALINVERDLSALVVNGAMTLGQFRAGNSLGSLTAGSLDRSRISVGDNLGPVVVTGNVLDTSIQAGGDLGADAAPGGTGFNADRTSTGNITSVTVGGTFVESDVVAGLLRGEDGFFGTADDQAAAGRSNIGLVKITGAVSGSNLGSETYRVAATGAVAGVNAAGVNVTQSGNFRVENLATKSNPLRVQDLIISEQFQTWNATFFFNQDIDAGTISAALSIFEVRNGGLTLVPLVLGADYTIIPSAFKDRAVVQISRSVTDRNLIPTGGAPAPGSATPGTQDPALPGPGVFRFILNKDVLRATVADARLDGDLTTPGENNFSHDTIVGDAGDKRSAEVIADADGQLFDMYAPADLDVVLDNNATPDGQPDANIVYTVRGQIGDHPDQGVSNFRPASDSDIYKITLRAGQILRLGAMQGAALFAGRFLLNANGDVQGGSTADTLELPTDPLTTIDLTTAEAFLIRTTGTYFVAITNDIGNITPGFLPDTVPAGSDTGDYNFTVQVFDDGDTGFGAPTNSGNGTPVIDAPAAIIFAGPNGVFQDPSDPTYDDRSEVLIGDFRFTLDAGPDGIRGTSDDVVSGNNSAGITSERRGSQLTSTINSAIGPVGHRGVPGDVAVDADAFLLNNGQLIDAGRTITIKVKLADLGADLGSFSRLTGTDFRGDVQFGVFDVTNSTGLDDGALLFSPTDFKSIAQKQKVIATEGAVTYGYDAKGDFYITFVTAGRIGGLATDPAKYAVYIQGVFNTDYTIEISQTESAPPASITQTKQNFLIETRGGTINWLEAGGLSTTLAPFSAAVMGFTGTTAGGVPVGDFILNSLVAKLNSVFTANGLNVRFSTNPAEFEFEDFSKVFISATTDPITIFNTDNFGYSQHSDPFNADKNDEAVLFLPSFDQLGYTPAQADLDDFVLSLTGAVGRRAGELMGLRLEGASGTNPIDIMASDSVNRFAGQTTNYGYNDSLRALSDQFDSTPETNFFLGRQNAFALLNKFLTP